MRGNTIDRYAAYRTARESGWLSINEIRKRENLNTIGEQGDKYIMPLNFADVEYVEPPPEAVRENTTPPVETSSDWLVDSVRRAVAIIRNASNRKANKEGAEDWDSFVQGDEPLCKKVETILEPCCRSMGVCEQEVGNELVGTWRSAIETADTSEMRVEACDNWAKSFLNGDSATVLIERSKQHE